MSAGCHTVGIRKGVDGHQRRCTSCYTCMRVCPQGAIQEEVRVSLEEMRIFVDGLCGKVDAIKRRIDGLTQKNGER